MRRWQLVALWLVAVVAATAITWQIVSFADNRLGPSDTLPEIAGPPLGTSSTSTTTPGSSTTSSLTTSTTVPGSTTTVPSADRMTIPTAGGTVTVSVTPGAITLVSVDPAAGFTAEIDERGPPEVRVELNSDSIEVEVRVRWKDGRVEVEVDD